MTVRTARYMGLRTYRYSPRTTRCSGGAGGAGVPRPSIANCATDPRTPGARGTHSPPPMPRTGPGTAAPACQPVSHQGTSPATTPGAITRKPALPAMAAFVCIGACLKLSCLTLAGRLLPDRHVLVAFAGERLPPPPAPPPAQPHPRELGHQVELGGPPLPERDRGARAAAVGALDV